MHIDLIPYFEDYKDYSGCAGGNYDMVILFDIFRATSTITALVKAGAESVTVSGSTEALTGLKSAHGDIFICGERGGLPPEGFDSGNSPLEILKLDLHGRDAYITTTNGTRALKAFRNFSSCYRAVSLFNVEYAAKCLIDGCTDNLLMICAGTENQFSVEDYAAAAMLVNCLTGKTDVEKTDVIKICDRIGAAYNGNSKYLRDDLADSFHARRLEKIGKKTDVEFILGSVNTLEVFAELSIL